MPQVDRHDRMAQRGGIVANRHFGKIADVWKHLALCEVLAQERPARYAETHAGSAAYEPAEDAERRYGVHRFHRVAAGDPLVAGSRYAVHLGRILGGDDGTKPDGRLIPGSPLIAMLELQGSSRYLLCDMDPRSAGDLATWAARLGLDDRVTVITGDGMAAVAREMLDQPQATATLVHVDPYDPDAREPGSMSALELTARMIDAGIGVMYWYGFDVPADRAWALRALYEATGATLWCGDVLVTAADGAVRDDGDLGRATTPGTGFGIVLANVGRASLDRCHALGDAFARAYEGAPLPGGGGGALDFQVTVSARA